MAIEIRADVILAWGGNTNENKAAELNPRKPKLEKNDRTGWGLNAGCGL